MASRVLQPGHAAGRGLRRRRFEKPIVGVRQRSLDDETLANAGIQPLVDSAMAA